jgi:hypothetical protein
MKTMIKKILTTTLLLTPAAFATATENRGFFSEIAENIITTKTGIASILLYALAIYIVWKLLSKKN